MKSIRLNLIWTILIFSLLSIDSSAQLNGNYSIGGVSPDFGTIQSAVDALNMQGVSGNVTFKLRPGTYNEKITIGLISGISVMSQVTFESETADSSSVWWTSASSNDATNYVVKCETARFIKFKKITFRNSGFGSGVFILSNGTSNLSIENCHFSNLAVPTSIHSRYIQIYSINTVDSNLYIQNNRLDNVGYGIYLSGQNSTLRDSNLIVTGNTISGYQGITLTNIENCTISRNKLNMTNTGIVISGFGNPLNIVGNNVIADDKALVIQQNQYNPSVLAPLWIINNFFIGRMGACQVLSGSGTTQIINNSIYNRSDWANDYDALTIGTSCGISNNILVNQEAGAALRISTTGVTVISDYNLMHTPGLVLVKRGSSNFATIQNWQSYVLGQDQHSWQQIPNFMGQFDLHILANSYLYNLGQANPQITTDIDGEPRVGLPDIGADEFVQPAVDAEVYPIYQGVEEFDCSGVKNLQVNLRNNGIDPLVAATINWSINGINQVPINWTGNVTYTNLSPAIDLQFTLFQDSFARIRVWVTNPNGITDINPNNDILQIDTLWTIMGGIYEIGNPNLDYETIQDAVDDLHLRGTCGNVTLNLANGTYVESVTLLALERETPNDTLFIVSASGNRDSVIWTQTYFDDEWALNVFNVSNVIFRDITFSNSSTSNFTKCVHIDPSYSNAMIGNNASNFEFNNCLFTSHTPYYSGRGIFYRDEGHNFRVLHCKFENLKKAIDQGDNWYVPSPEIVPFAGQIVIKDNEFFNIREKCIQVNYQKDLYILRNYFYNPIDTIYTSASVAIIINVAHGDLRIEENRFNGPFDGVISLGFYGTPGNNGKIQNNFFSCIHTGGYGGLSLLYLVPQDSTYLELVNNSFNLVHRAPAFGLLGSFVNTSAFNNYLIVKNNSFKADSIKNIFWGCFPIVNPNIGHNNVFVDNLVEGYDYTAGMTVPPNTTLFQPSYVSFEDLHLTGEELLGQGINLGVLYDIDSVLRPDPPTIGATEAILRNYDVLVSNTYAATNCDSVSFLIDLQNNGHIAIDSVWIHYTINSIADSVLLTNTIQPGALYDSILLMTFPLIRDSNYIISVQAELVDTTDQFPLNNFYNWSVTYPITPIPYIWEVIL